MPLTSPRRNYMVKLQGGIVCGFYRAHPELKMKLRFTFYGHDLGFYEAYIVDSIRWIKFRSNHLKIE